MTVIGLCGLNGCGKSVIASELIKNFGFKAVKIKDTADNKNALFMSIEEELNISNEDTLEFSNVEEAKCYLTSKWKENFVITNLDTRDDFEELMTRPFFMVISVLAPIRERFSRCQARTPSLKLEDLINRDDFLLYENGLVHIISNARLTISNGSSLEKLKKAIKSTNLNERWLRPNWDAYFMEMAELASKRSNCMKRCVGAVIVKDKRVVSTGYNGTARGLVNCCDGGCPRCNDNAKCGVALEHCYCLHAEENALLEANRARCQDATLYCTTAPCLGCSQKIIQCGIIRVVYAREYSIEHNARDMMGRVGVELDKFTHDVPRYINAEDF